jgi:hypothetical protein
VGRNVGHGGRPQVSASEQALEESVPTTWVANLLYSSCSGIWKGDMGVPGKIQACGYARGNACITIGRSLPPPSLEEWETDNPHSWPLCYEMLWSHNKSYIIRVACAIPLNNLILLYRSRPSFIDQNDVGTIASLDTITRRTTMTTSHASIIFRFLLQCSP